MNEEVKRLIDEIVSWRSGGTSESGMREMVATLIAAVRKVALEDAYKLGEVYVAALFKPEVPGWEPGGAYYDGYVKGATDYREGIRALVVEG